MNTVAFKRSVSITGAFLFATCVLAATPAVHTTFQPGDLVVGGQTPQQPVPSPRLHWILPDGSLNKRLVERESQGYPSGTGFSRQGRLFVTLENRLHRFTPAGIDEGTISGVVFAPASMAFDAIGNLYVGGPGQAITKLAPDGAILGTFAVASDGLAKGWPNGVDLANDQCTVYYTIGRHVMRYDVCRNVQLTPPNGAPLPGLSAFGLRLLQDGRVLVATGQAVYLLASDGSVIRAFDVPGEDSWVAVALGLDGRSFWTGSGVTVYQFSTDGGPPLSFFETEDYLVRTLTVLGEPRAAYAASIPALSTRATLLLALALAACGLSIAKRSA